MVAPAVAAAAAHPGDDGGTSDLLIASLLLVALGSIAFGARGVIRPLRRG